MIDERYVASQIKMILRYSFKPDKLIDLPKIHDHLKRFELASN